MDALNDEKEGGSRNAAGDQRPASESVSDRGQKYSSEDCPLGDGISRRLVRLVENALASPLVWGALGNLYDAAKKAYRGHGRLESHIFNVVLHDALEAEALSIEQEGA